MLHSRLRKDQGPRLESWLALGRLISASSSSNRLRDSRRPRLWLLGHGLGRWSVFLILYFGLFFLEHPRALLHIAGMMLLGLLFQPIDHGACTFFIFAAAMLPLRRNAKGSSHRVPGRDRGHAAVASIEGLLLHILIAWTHLGLFFPLSCDHRRREYFSSRSATARTRQSASKANEEIEHLAKVAERERIARDLHDVLGHTLSVITLKSELAWRVDRSRSRSGAGKEIREVEEISRQALIGRPRCDSRIPLAG